MDALTPHPSERPRVRPILVFLPSAKANDLNTQSSVPTSSTMIASSSSVSSSVSSRRGQVIGLESEASRAATLYDSLSAPAARRVFSSRDWLIAFTLSDVGVALTASLGDRGVSFLPATIAWSVG